MTEGVASTESQSGAAERRKKIQDDKDFTSSRISETSRYIAFGLVGAIFTAGSSSSAFMRNLAENRPLLVAIAAFGCVTILLDYLQYVFGYLASGQAQHNIAGGFRYDTKSFFYRVRSLCFFVKQGCCIAGTVLFIAAIFLEI